MYLWNAIFSRRISFYQHKDQSSMEKNDVPTSVGNIPKAKFLNIDSWNWRIRRIRDCDFLSFFRKEQYKLFYNYFTKLLKENEFESFPQFSCRNPKMQILYTLAQAAGKMEISHEIWAPTFPDRIESITDIRYMFYGWQLLSSLPVYPCSIKRIQVSSEVDIRQILLLTTGESSFYVYSERAAKLTIQFSLRFRDPLPFINNQLFVR